MLSKFLTFFILLILLPQAIHANEKETISTDLVFTPAETAYLKEKKSIKMCVDPSWMPFEMIQDGKHIGMAADYIQVISTKINTPITAVITKTWSESIEYAKKRKCDIFSMAMETPERKKFMNFTRPYLIVPLVIATTVDKFYISDIKEVLDKKIGVVKGYAYIELLKIKYPTITLVEVENTDDGLKKVADEKLFGFLGNLTTIGYKMQQSYIGTLKITGHIDDNWNLGIGVRNDEQILFDILDKVVASIDERTHQRILNKWMNITFEQGFDYSLFWKILAFVAIIIFFILLRYRAVNNYNKDIKKHLCIIDKNVLTSSCDLNGIITDASQALCAMSGYTKDELIGQNHNIFRHPDIKDELFEELWRTITSGQSWSGEIQNKRKNGSSYWIDVHISPILAKDGTIEGYTAIRQDITDKKRIEELSITDPLTKISNRLHLHNTFKREIEFAHRYKTMFAVILIDVDHFKNVNDTFGHDIGDKVLQEIASILQDNIRGTDILGRWGGEEFLIICHETNTAQAAKIAEKIRVKIENTAFEYVGIQTCSFGVSEYSLLDGNSDAVVKRADKALYEAKEKGRNRVVSAH